MIEILNSRKHDRGEFQCGIVGLDAYIKVYASQEMKKKVSTPFVLTEPPDRKVLGYYCLSSYSISMADLDKSLSKGLPRYPLIPAILLGRLAVDASCQGKGYGELLLLDAMKRALDISNQVASVALVVDAMNDKALSFYYRYGFIQFPTVPMKLYISMGEISKLVL